MANLQIKGVHDELYEEIKRVAEAENRSVSQQVLFLIRDYLARRRELKTLKCPADVLLELSGSWEDDREPGEIVAEIKAARKNSTKLRKGF
jgi:hypothetical protein